MLEVSGAQMKVEGLEQAIGVGLSRKVLAGSMHCHFYLLEEESFLYSSRFFQLV